MANKIDYSKMSFEELYEHFSNITGKTRTQEWNQFASDAPDYLCKFSDYLKDIKFDRVTSKGKKVKTNAFKELTKSIRDNAVAAAWDRERELIKLGKGTYNWSVAEQDLILNSKGIPPIQEKLGIKYEGQHMYSAATYPQYAGNADNIQFLTYKDHRKGAHNGNTRKYQTKGYYDEITKKMHEFGGAGIDDGFPPVIELTKVKVDGEEVLNPSLSKYEKLFPGFSQFDDSEKVLIQRLDYLREVTGSTDDISEFILKNCRDVSNISTGDVVDGKYLSELANRSLAKLDLSNITNFPSKYADMIKFGGLGDSTRKELADLTYKLKVQKVDPSTIDMKKLIKNCDASDILDDCKKMRADDFLEFMFKNVDIEVRFKAPHVFKGGTSLKALPAFSGARNSGMTIWLKKQAINIISDIRKNPEVEKLVAKGLGKRVVNELLDAPDLIEFAVLCVDIYKGVSNGTMTIEEAGKKVFDWGVVVLGSETGALIGSSIAPPIGSIVGGILGGTLAAIFGEYFYDDLCAGAFNFWDSLFSDGDHLLEGDSGNDVFNYAHGDFDRYAVREFFCNPDETEITFDIESKGGNDYVAGYQNNDTLVGGDGNDILIGCGGDDYIYGDARQADFKVGNEELMEYYRDVIYGGSGNDWIYGGTGNDIIYGDGIRAQSEATENDIFMMPKLSLSEKWQEPLFEIFNPYNELDTTYNDTIFGEDGSDFIMGGQGNDTIRGGNDDDVIYGEGDDDRIYGEEGDDFIDGGEGNNIILEGGNGDDYIVSGSGNDTIYGDKENGTSSMDYGNDTIIVEAGTNHLVGGSYDDYIRGGSGNDTIYGDNDNGYSDYRDGDDVIFGGDGNDTIHAGGGDDYIDAGNGSDTIYCDSGKNEVYGGDGWDIVWGGTGVDTIYGGGTADSLHGGDNDDIIEGEEGGDFIFGEDGHDELYGGIGNDTINGGDGNDYISGGDDNDTLYGGEGYDVLDGGAGNDILEGNEGIDSYIFGYGYGNDTVNDKYGTSFIELGEIDIEDIVYDMAENGHDLIFSFESSSEDTLTIYNFDELREKYYFWIDDESYQIDENGDFIPKDPPHSGGGGSSGWGGSILDDIGNDIITDSGKRFGDAGKAQPPRDPLIIDLNGDGVHTTSVADGVHFDLDNNGFRELTAWIDRTDGFLVYNRDDNPRITNGSELFSDQVIYSDGTRSTDGFDVLKTFNTYTDDEKNHETDGQINELDAEFGKLQVWIDKDHDGVTWLPAEGEDDDPKRKELFTLEELGITSISTNYRPPENEDEDDPNKELFANVIINGKIHTISEHWFEADTSKTQEINPEGVDDDRTSFGHLHSVAYALNEEKDEEGYLHSLVNKFNSSDDYAEKRILTKKILYHISGADSIAANSRGGAIDARDLHVVETIMGVKSFIGVGNSENPNSNAASILKEIYNKFENLYFVLLNANTKSSDYLDLISETINVNHETVLNVSLINQVINERIDNDEEVDEMLCSVGAFIKAYDHAKGTQNFVQFKKTYSSVNDYFARMADANFVLGSSSSDSINGTSGSDIIYAEDGNDTINANYGDDIIYGGDGNDTVNAGAGNDIVYAGNDEDTVNAGAGDDVVYGESGNDIINGEDGNDNIYAGEGNDMITGGAGEDTLYGDDGNDTIDGGEGNDIIYAGDGDDVISAGTGDDVVYGGDGDDTYHISAEHGNDIIYDSEGVSTLIFDEEIDAEAYSLNIDINNGITLVNTETEETISIPDFINVPEKYDFVFNGENKILGGGESRQVIEGTESDDILKGGNGFNIIRGGEGNDTITGGDNLDFIYGGEGDDTITGGNGTNIIHGDEGNDTITDGSGSSYLDGGDGNDTIHAGDGNDVVLGGAGADKLYGEDGDDVIAGNEGNDEIYVGNGDDTVYADAGNDTVHGGDGNDSLFGGNGYDTLYGDEGDDYLEAGNGEDTLYGGEGNDVLVGGTGVNNMYGDEGDDTFYGGNGINNMYGGDGDDNFTGGEFADYIEGGAGNDKINGGNGENHLFGNEGDDEISGGDDDDYIEGGDGNDTIYGGNGVNTIYGDGGNDIIHGGDNGSLLYGGDGDDEIYGGGGADTLDGGKGNDTLQGDHDDDTYIFDKGYGVDTVYDAGGNNTIVIHGYTVADMHNLKYANRDLSIDFGENTGDRLIVKGFFEFKGNSGFEFVFDDGTVLDQSQIEAVNAPVYGTKNTDQISLIDDTGWKVYAGEGNDTVYGQGGDDELYGEAGDDKLYGNSGNDILDGGAGNDVLNGGTGENTYVYGEGYDMDVIEDSADSCTIVIHDYSTSEMNNVRDGMDLIISFGNETGDTLTVKSFFTGNFDRKFKFVFDDGTVLVKSDIKAKATPIVGSDKDDNIDYTTNEDDIIDGGLGNDVLAGQGGEDTYIFGKGYGNDTINEWGSDHSFVDFKDINSDEITITGGQYSPLIITVNDTEDSITLYSWSWSSSTYTFRFADGAEGYVDRETLELVLTKQPDVAEEEEDVVEQTAAEYLADLYTDDVFSGELIADNTVIADVADSVSIGDESDEISDIANVQAMILAENMSAFSNDSQISDGIKIGDITSDSSALDQLLVNSALK